MNAMDNTGQTLHRCNLALLRATDENGLLQSICRILVEVGGFRMVWIGYPRNDPEKSILPVAHAGRENGDRKSTRLNSSHQIISYAVFCLKKKKNRNNVQ